MTGKLFLFLASFVLLLAGSAMSVDHPTPGYTYVLIGIVLMFVSAVLINRSTFN